jgi:diaminopimelate decarboxylase
LRLDARALTEAFPSPWIRLYSLKANGLPPLIRDIANQGIGANAVSSGEISLAQRADVPVRRTALEGIGKTSRDFALVADLAARGTPLLWVSLESAEDAAALAAALGRHGASQDVLVRVNPQVTPETHHGLAVGAPASKFGIAADELPAVIEAGGGPRGALRWRGLHLHVGSQLGAVDAWRSAFRVGLRLLELQRAELRRFDTLDAGGGFPVAYGKNSDTVPPLSRFAQEAAAELAAIPEAARPKRLAVEPGRALVAASGWLIGQVLHVRRREPPIVVLDAGMTELVRPALYGAVHPMFAIDKDGPLINVRIDGPVCESTDTLGTTALPALERGDLVAIGMAGAYASSMFSAYNGRPRPPEIGWDNGRLAVLRSRGRTTALP